MFKEIENQGEIFSLFVSKIGEDNQELKVAEECSELSQAIIKYSINPTDENYYHVNEEMGDVLNAIDSFCFIYDLDINHIHNARIEKLQKTFKKMQDEQE